MCDLSFVKSTSAGELLNRVEMTLENGAQETSTLKRTFTLPRNPFNSARMSKRRPKTGENELENVRDLKIVNGDGEKNSKKVFRRPSIKKIISSINKIAQHISGVPGLNQNLENNRVPPVDIQTWGPNDTPGVTGLENQGNTCFINAILQCISHTDILAEYFVLDKYKIDLARRNKLNSKKFGTKGEVTEQLAVLLKSLWACQYYSELSMSFKHVLGRHGTQYRGNQQHDAQEFLLWLLDKVHEDLNTASKKKYKSVKGETKKLKGGAKYYQSPGTPRIKLAFKNWRETVSLSIFSLVASLTSRIIFRTFGVYRTSGRPDEVIAAETLENYRRCNNSFIQGVFQAQYRSSLSCSRCRTQSNTFDPFQCISVQLPQFHKQSIYVTVVYTSQQPRQVQIGLSLPSGSSIGELRAILESDTSIEKENMLLTEIGDCGFMRTFNNSQSISMISEIDPIYCIETAQLEENDEEITSAYVLLCWINVARGSGGGEFSRFGSPYTMQVSRETSYDDLQKLILKEMAPILHDDILTSSQSKGVFKMRISDPAWNETEPPCYLEPQLEHPLFMEAVDQALALCSDDGGPPHVKLVLEWTDSAKKSIIADQSDAIEEHSTVKMLRAQALQGGAPLTLQECLQDYTGAETLTDAWRCPHCKQYQPVVKTLDVWSLPDILIVHFKRFRQHTIRGGNSSKLTTMVNFPVYGFDMSPHLAAKRHPQNLPPNNMTENEMINISNGWSPWKRPRKQSNCHENIYDLYGVCYHHGSDLETGHYTAACRNPYDQNWYLYDDAKVVNLSKDSEDVTSLLVNNSAYILFYQRRCVGTSNSSAASTSSVGSGSDHWACRMPKFVPPKCVPAVVKQPEKVEKSVQIKDDPRTIEREGETKKDSKVDEVVALRNSQNTLYSSRKSLEIKVSENIRNSPTLSLNLNRSSSEISTKKPIYTTSVYINSTGNPEIVSSSPKKSQLLESVRQEDINVILREPGLEKNDTPSESKKDRLQVYTTTASIHRHSDIEKGVPRTQLNWMSPQPLKKSSSANENTTMLYSV